MTTYFFGLEEGMTKTLEYNCSFRLWVTKGLPIDIKILAGRENITNICVSKNMIDIDSKFHLGVIIDEGDGFIEGLGGEFSDLGELKEKHPQLFEVDGRLYAFP